MKANDALDDLAGIWILASNDKNNLITFEGIRYRLDLPDGYDVGAVIKKRGDLFRLGSPSAELQSWKNAMMAGDDLPSYIRAKSPKERISAINAITKDNVFRTQFRVSEHAPVSSIEQIEWGLKYIERLRAAAGERERRRFAWFKELALPTVTVLVALLSVCVVACFNYLSIVAQKRNTEFQVKFIPEEQAFDAFSLALDDSLVALMKIFPRSNPDLGSHERNLDATFYSILPFLSQTQRAHFNELENAYRHDFLDKQDGQLQQIQSGSIHPVTDKVYKEAYDVAGPKINDTKQFLIDSLFQDEAPSFQQKISDLMRSYLVKPSKTHSAPSPASIEPGSK